MRFVSVFSTGKPFMIRSLSRSFVLVLASLVLVACSGPKSGTDDDSGPSPDAGTPTAEERARASVAQYENFDVSAYPVRAPDQTVEVTHQVPRRLMQGQADQGSQQTLEGYRIQVYSAQEQKASQQFRENVRRWWRRAKEDAPDVFQGQPPIVIEYSQPYYRVRIGAFADREDAEEALEFVSKKYEGAFVAQSTVTVVQ